MSVNLNSSKGVRNQNFDCLAQALVRRNLYFLANTALMGCSGLFASGSI